MGEDTERGHWSQQWGGLAGFLVWVAVVVGASFLVVWLVEALGLWEQ
jgi:hypothetical protein